ncbi:MAG: Crp/Fnr family transcriptional regulator [Fibrobacter sp.]|nr:Crp/Fnr family transcriptional regulator [Fibrobacter sp.]
MAISNIITLLKGVDLFSSLDDKQLEPLAFLMEKQAFEKDEVIILEEDSATHALFLIASGEVKVYVTASDKRDTILTLLGKGDFFGEMSLIDEEPRSASVRAVSKSEILVLKREHFLEKVYGNPDLAMTLMSVLSKRLRKANRQIGSLALLTVYGRVAGTILNLAEDKGVRSTIEDGRVVIIIRNMPTQRQLAEMSGTTRETVSRVLSQLQTKGLIAVVNREMIILEEKELKQGKSETSDKR